MRFFLSLYFVFCFAFTSQAQFNLGVNITSGRTSPSGLDNILDRFNEDRPWLQTGFSEVDWLNGYGLGLRYKFDRIALDFKWENQINRTSASGTDPNTNSGFEQTLFFKISTFGFGIESFLTDQISLHGNFEFNRFRVRTEVTNLDDRFDLLNNWSTGSTFSIGYNFVSRGLVHISIRPYLTVGWDEHPLNDLDDSLNPNLPRTDSFNEEFLNYGLKVIFYNGPWY